MSLKVASTLNWWAEAGVDLIVGETPRDWLSPAPPPARIEPVAPEPVLAPLPDDLAGFRDWLMISHSLPGAGPSMPRLGPEGAEGAELMVLTDMPSAADFAAGQLISSEGLFDRMVGAIDMARTDIYVATLIPFRLPSGSLDSETLNRLSKIARHHVALVGPSALLLLGDGASRAMLDGNVAQSRSRWHEIETPRGPLKTLATLKPEQLLLQPGLKKLAWADLQMLREGMIQ